MNLVVYSKISGEELESLILKYFSDIKNKDLNLQNFSKELPFDQANLGYYFLIEPLKDKNNVSQGYSL
jgi:secreted Zn-dependent insulinase-like peptidase